MGFNKQSPTTDFQPLQLQGLNPLNHLNIPTIKKTLKNNRQHALYSDETETNVGSFFNCILYGYKVQNSSTNSTSSQSANPSQS
jgi:hypothetical protein